jgi:DNA polymerase V
MLAYKIPLSFSSVQAGFPSPADDYLDGQLNIHTHLVKKPASTLFIMAPDNSMVDFGIFINDLLIVDMSIKPTHNKIIVADIEGERVVRKYIEKKGRCFLVEGEKQPLYFPINSELGVNIIGVVTYSIHDL